MGSEYYELISSYVFGFYMAWNFGANDVANSTASAVGAKTITIRQTLFIACILNIIGAAFIGSHFNRLFQRANGPPWAEGILKRIDFWRGKAAMNDDLTMVEIWRVPPR